MQSFLQRGNTADKSANNEASAKAAAESLPAEPMSPNTNKNPFLHAWHDPLASLKTVSSCIDVADLNRFGLKYYDEFDKV
jgi:hypothetical protein